MASELVVLRSGARMPLVGLGTWKAPKGTTRQVVYEAIRQGYRHLDCACDYGNEEEVGEAIQQAIAEGICTREDLWITSKLWNTFHAAEHVELACRKTLQDLKLDYVDLYLIHFPISLKYVPIEVRYPPEWIHDPNSENPRMEFADVPVSETWGAMEQLVDKGLVKHIGVSNFCAQSVMDLVKYARIKPEVNQIELHPYLNQRQLVDWLATQDIHVTGYSPLGSSSYVQLGGDHGLGVGVLAEESLQHLATRKGKSVAQIVLRWSVQRGCSVVPKTVTPARLQENISVFDFTLTEEEMEAIDALNRNVRFNDPGVYGKFMGAAWPIFA